MVLKDTKLQGSVKLGSRGPTMYGVGVGICSKELSWCTHWISLPLGEQVELVDTELCTIGQLDY